ncbi:oligosaccharide flippase family protein [Vibrio parahaemolyticus]|uniref:Polysaccharide biosynthesis protein n=1 Tax=Vibrio parahaemolyticus TaxID=670 RepID=A0A5P4S9A3_VIBPH|nr:oligosaccharide flippase family protein [Vibrio parahaemolyticus]QFC18413.1 polysaccharide biosynthesis protein [Vibrio parahaemolyticus]
MSKLKEITKNFIGFGVIDLIGLVIPIVTMPLLTRALGATSYGIYLLILTVLYFGHTIIDYGTHYTSVRELSKNRNNFSVKNSLFVQTQSLRLFLATVYILCCLGYAVFYGSEEFLFYMSVAAIPYLIGYALTPVWYYQGMSEMMLVTKVMLASKFANLLVILFFINNESDISNALMATSLPSLLSGIYLTYSCKKNEKLSIKFSFGFLSTLKSSFHVFIGLLAPNLYNSIPTIILGTSYPPEQFAKFAIASRLCSVVVTLQNVLAKAVYPVISRIKESQVSKLIIANVFVSVPPIIFIFLFGEYVLGVFLGKEFSSANEYLIILIVGVLFVGVANSYSQGYLLPKGLDKLYRNISLRVSLISGGLALVLITHYGLIGGALSITTARFLFFMDYYVSYKLQSRKVKQS